MNNMFDMWHGGKVSNREVMRQKMRNLVHTGNVIDDTAAAVEAYSKLPPAQKLESVIAEKKERKWTVVCNEKSAPYVGERY